MDSLEMKLKRALKPDDPPGGFADRVLARIRTGRVTDPSPRPWWRAWLVRPAWRVALAGGLACLMLIGLGLSYRWHKERLEAERERIKGEQAHAQLLLALEVTSSTLDHVGQIVVEESRRPRGGRR